MTRRGFFGRLRGSVRESPPDDAPIVAGSDEVDTDTVHEGATLKWWGELDFSEQQQMAWRFGSLYLRLSRAEHEWSLEYHRPQHQHEHQQDWQYLPADEDFPQPLSHERYMFNQTTQRFFLLPRLADRSIVIKPVRPIYIPAGQQAMLFISTPLWICGMAELGQPALFDFPVIRPKDTWFGASKMTGQLCYATPVDGSTELELLHPRAFRAVTPMQIINNTHQQMRLERINVPVPLLPLLHSETTGRLWTSQIEVVQEFVDRPPRLRIDSRTPPMAGEVSFVQPARTEYNSFVSNMFESWF